MGILINEFRLISRLETLLLQDIAMMRINRLEQELTRIKQNLLPVSWEQHIPGHGNYQSLEEFSCAF